MATNAYIRSRKLATDGILELEGPGFKVCSLDAPFVLGTLPGMRLPMFEGLYPIRARQDPDSAFRPRRRQPISSPVGRLSEAIAGALEHGVTGKAILVGDENLSFAEYFELFFRAAGNNVEVPSLDQEHPMLPDAAIYTGRGNFVTYEPDAELIKPLNYRRNDIARAVREIVDQYRC